MEGPLFERPSSSDIDPLDLQLDRLGAAPGRAAERSTWQTRLAISWSTGSFPAVLLVLLGIAFGPEGLALLTPGVLALIDPAVPVALAALGVVAGLSMPARRSGEGRLFAAAVVESLATGVLVAGGLRLVAPAISATEAIEMWLFVLAAGVCASTSSPMPSTEAGTRPLPLRIRDLDALPAIVAGALLLAATQDRSFTTGLLLGAQAGIVALVIAVAGWLLLTATSSETEQRIFGVAALLLVGGVADYLSLSALLSGVIAGACWQLAGGPAREAIGRDIGYVQHPLVVILLLVAGAQVSFSSDALALAVAYVLLRTVGKLAGGWMAGKVVRPLMRRPARLHLTTPGIFGVAFATNVVRTGGIEMSALLSVVVLGTIASQLVSAFGEPREEA